MPSRLGGLNKIFERLESQEGEDRGRECDECPGAAHHAGAEMGHNSVL